MFLKNVSLNVLQSCNFENNHTLIKPLFTKPLKLSYTIINSSIYEPIAWQKFYCSTLT